MARGMPTAQPTMTPILDFFSEGWVGDGPVVEDGEMMVVWMIVDTPAVPDDTEVWRLVTEVADDDDDDALLCEEPLCEDGCEFGVADGCDPPPEVAMPVKDCKLGA